ncbi:hypothetical protein ACQEVS_08720 [Streptomyces sp. CA-181903]|uniref:hypothetical protein n=1 Tax=Streptomyces sp. CA-181903 TaxID=3240055 RepID=UPI003D92B603
MGEYHGDVLRISADDLRAAAPAFHTQSTASRTTWRTFAHDVEGVVNGANGKAQELIHHNKGEAIEAFDEFWRRYYHDGKGWLHDLAAASRDLADALEAYADEAHKAEKQLEHKLEIVGATIVAGTALAIFTAGISEAAAGAATAAVVEFAGALGASVSAEIATIAGTTLASAAMGGIESVAVDLAVAQPLSISLGEQKGFNLDEVHDSALYGGLTAGALGGGASTYKAIKDAGGPGGILGKFNLDFGGGPQFAAPGGVLPGAGAGAGSFLDRFNLIAWKEYPPEVIENFKRGNKFNSDNHWRYPANEVHLKNGKRLDSYDPGTEIVSRKHTQLGEIEVDTAKKYLSELAKKYAPDTVIRSNKYPDLDGSALKGEMILEVPVQKGGVPREIIEHAQELKIAIRDVEGRFYTDE